MTKSAPGRAFAKRPVVFFREFLKHPKQVASFLPSFGFLERRILKAADVGAARTVVELGPGTGGTTRALLERMRPNARLLAIEINPRFHRELECIDDERLIAHHGHAGDLRESLERHDLPAPSVIVSGIPFSTIEPDEGERIMSEIASVLEPSGRFVAYQVSSCVAGLCRPFLGEEEKTLALFNIPPIRVYAWEKSA